MGSFAIWFVYYETVDRVPGDGTAPAVPRTVCGLTPAVDFGGDIRDLLEEICEGAGSLRAPC
jgi:hypothetical protein